MECKLCAAASPLVLGWQTGRLGFFGWSRSELLVPRCASTCVAAGLSAPGRLLKNWAPPLFAQHTSRGRLQTVGRRWQALAFTGGFAPRNPRAVIRPRANESVKNCHADYSVSAPLVCLVGPEIALAKTPEHDLAGLPLDPPHHHRILMRLMVSTRFSTPECFSSRERRRSQHRCPYPQYGRADCLRGVDASTVYAVIWLLPVLVSSKSKSRGILVISIGKGSDRSTWLLVTKPHGILARMSSRISHRLHRERG